MFLQSMFSIIVLLNIVEVGGSMLIEQSAPWRRSKAISNLYRSTLITLDHRLFGQ